MNAFEDIVALALEEEGFWIKKSVKIDISKSEKRKIGTPSMPRPEIDIVACNIKTKEIWFVEAKSFFDSPGVKFKDVNGENKKGAKRYKLFTNKFLRNIVTASLMKIFSEKGLILESFKPKYVLVAGKVCAQDEDDIKEYFYKKGWVFWSPSKLRGIITKMAEKGWEDNPVIITSKLLLRPKKLDTIARKTIRK